MISLYLNLWAALQAAPIAATVPTPSYSQAFSVQDLRTAKQRKTKRLSSLILNCNFNIFSVGEEGFGKRRVGANRVARLQNYLLGRFGTSLASHRLDIAQYYLVINGAAGGTAYAMGAAMGGGILAPALADGVSRRPKCSRERMITGWFDPASITNNHTPLVIDIQGSFDGQPIDVHVVRSPNRDLTSGMFWIDYTAQDQADFDALVDDAMRKIGDEIQARLK